MADFAGKRARPVGCCGGRDLGPMRADEGPSEQDVEMFGGTTRVCKACDTELHDDIMTCWQCGHTEASAGQRGLPTWAVVTSGLLVTGLVTLILL
jgi:hypothetical protein